MERKKYARYDWKDLVGHAFDYAAGQPDGFTVEDLMAELEVTHPIARQVINRLRHELGTGDSINLVADPAGKGERWTYKLVGHPDDALPWQQNRLGDMESRLVTIHSVAASMLRSVDRRTREGKRAAVIEKSLRHLLEDLESINSDVSEAA